MSAIVDEIRTNWKINDQKRDAGLTTPEDVERFDDIPYGSAAPEMQRLDLYRPKSFTGKLPVIVSVHGGGWVYGDKELYQFYCMDLARRGFAVVNFTYRLAPEYKWPAQFEDVNAAFAWTLAHADEYAMDAENVFAVGDSAGGHMLSLYCDFCVNPDYAARFDFAPPVGFVPRAVALNCGVYEITCGTGRDGLMNELLPGGVTSEGVEALCSNRFVKPGFPPTFLMTAQGDTLTDEPEKLTPALKACGVPFEYHFYTDEGRSLWHVFHLSIREDIAKRCNDEEAAFFLKIRKEA